MSNINKPPPEPWNTIKWRAPAREIEPSDNTDAVLLSGTPDSLSVLKDKISALDEGKWEYYKKITNPYELIFTTVSPAVPPSVSKLKPLSRSYFKMVEILSVFDLYDYLPKYIRTGHVCEGPGGFIQAIYDTSGRSGISVQKTYAMTLKPTHSYVPGWKRASAFLKRNPQIKILYGSTGTGDILDALNRDYYVAKARRAIHLFTADGGVDFTTNYRGQEQTIFPILVASSLMAIRSLVNGGVYILKVFDCFGQNTLDLLMGLGSVFQRWTIYKPATSRPCNSEQYFVGMGFNVMSPNFPKLVSILENCVQNARFTHRLLKNLDNDTVSSLIDEQFERIHAQMENLEETFRLADENQVESHGPIWDENVEICKKFCKRFRIPY
jgi:23S rRNA U2552 (ribose-2'-O)-methylase RlmE/FtsJ